MKKVCLRPVASTRPWGPVRRMSSDVVVAIQYLYVFVETISMKQSKPLALCYITPVHRLATLPEVLAPLDHDKEDKRCSHGQECSTDKSILYAKFHKPGCDTARSQLKAAFGSVSGSYAWAVIAHPIVFPITMNVTITSPLKSIYVSMQYVMLSAMVEAAAADWRNAAKAKTNPMYRIRRDA